MQCLDPAAVEQAPTGCADVRRARALRLDGFGDEVSAGQDDCHGALRYNTHIVHSSTATTATSMCPVFLATIPASSLPSYASHSIFVYTEVGTSSPDAARWHLESRPDSKKVSPFPALPPCKCRMPDTTVAHGEHSCPSPAGGAHGGRLRVARDSVGRRSVRCSSQHGGVRIRRGCVCA